MCPRGHLASDLPLFNGRVSLIDGLPNIGGYVTGTLCCLIDWYALLTDCRDPESRRSVRSFSTRTGQVATSKQRYSPGKALAKRPYAETWSRLCVGTSCGCFNRGRP